jgi:hypothetical protein
LPKYTEVDGWQGHKDDEVPVDDEDEEEEEEGGMPSCLVSWFETNMAQAG